MSSSSSEKDVLLNQLADEFVKRYRQGERPALSEYTDKYPELASDIRDVFPALVEMEHVELEPISAQQQPKEGKPLPTKIGEFRILGEIGYGGMGVVYEAEQVSLGRIVALKVITEKLGDNAKLKRRFHREAKAVARMHHTNIVPIFGVGEEGGVPYYAMQLIRGLGLHDILDEIRRAKQREGALSSPDRQSQHEHSAVELAQSLMTGAFRNPSLDDLSESDNLDETMDAVGRAERGSRTVDSDSHSGTQILVSSAFSGSHDRSATRTEQSQYWQSVASLGEQAADALAYAHRQGVLHRDIKPSNLLLDVGGTVWVTDFGLAKLDDEQNLTEKQEILGTLRYMPPEAFEGDSDERSDVYSLGLTLYELLALRPAFDAEERLQLIQQVAEAEPVRLRTLEPRVPIDLETIVHKAIEPNPDHRYQSSDALAEDLRRFLADEPILARQPSLWERAARWIGRNKSVAVAVAAVILVLMAGISVSSWFAVNETAARGDAENARKKAEDLAEREAEGKQEQRRLKLAAERDRDLALQSLYLADIRQARSAIRDGELGQVLNQLEAHIPQPNKSDHRAWEWHYMLASAQRRVRTLHSVGGRAIDVRWSPDGRWLASIHTGEGVPHSRRNLLYLWDATTLEPVRVCTVGAIPRRVAWSPDSRLVAVTTEKGTIEIHRVDDGTSSELAGGKIQNLIDAPLAWSQDGERLATGAYINKPNVKTNIRIWDCRTWKLVDEIPAEWVVGGLSWNSTGDRLASSCKGCGVGLVVYEMPSKRVVKRVRDSRLVLSRVCWRPDGQMLLWGVSRTLTIWNAESDRMTRHTVHISLFRDCCWSPDGSKFASCGEDRLIEIRSTQTGQLLRTLDGHFESVHSIHWHPDGARLVTASQDGTIGVWDMRSLDSDEINRMWKGHPGRLLTLDWKSDGKKLLTVGADRVLCVWDSETGKCSQRISIPSITTALWNPSDQRIVSDTSHPEKGKHLQFWEPKSGEALDAYPTISSVTSVAASDDGRWFAVASGSQVQVLDATTGKPQWTLDLDSARTLLEFSPDGKRLLVNRWDAKSTIRETTTGKQLLELKNEWKYFRPISVAWSPDGNRVATATRWGFITIFDSQTGKPVSKLVGRGHRGDIYDLSWSPDGRRLATASADRTVRLWDAQTGEDILTLRGHQAPVRCVQWSPDGEQIASADHTGEIRIWDASLGYDLAHRRTIPWSVLGPFSPERNFDDATERTMTPQRHLVDSLGQAVQWQRLTTGFESRVNLGSLFDRPSKAVGYAVTFVHSSKEQQAMLLLGHDDAIRLRLNDEVIYENAAASEAPADSVRLPITLRAGWNRLLARVDVSKNSHRFALRLAPMSAETPLQKLRFAHLPRK